MATTNREKILVLVEAAVMVALSIVLSLFQITLPAIVFGGSVTLASSLPIALISYRRGLKVGLASAFLVSIVQLLMGLQYLSYAVNYKGVIAIIFVDYILPYTFIGLAGMFRNLNKSNKRGIQMLTFGSGILVAMILRFLCHFISGSVVWYEMTLASAETGSLILKYVNHPYIYSFVYNMSYMLPETIITLVVGVIIAAILNIKKKDLKF